jgi:hypothetical protein
VSDKVGRLAGPVGAGLQTRPYNRVLEVSFFIRFFPESAFRDFPLTVNAILFVRPSVY